jgi:hypothetical protein
LEHLLYFHAEWEHFEAIDVDEHNQITIDGFKAAAEGLQMGLSEDEAVYIFEQLDDEGYEFVDFDTFCSWAARRDQELTRRAAEGEAADARLEDRGWDAANADEASLEFSAISGGSYDAPDNSSWGAGGAADGASLEAALAEAEMSAPSWSDM